MPSDSGQQGLRSGLTNHSGILTVVLIYAVFAGLWILLSDKVVQMLISDPDRIILASLMKGWLFVAVTSLLLYAMMRRLIGREPVSEPIPAASRSSILPFGVLLSVIVVITGSGILNSFIQHKETEIARLQAIADLKTRQIVDWLGERQGDADFVESSDFFAEQYSRWQDSGDPLSGERMQKRLEQLRKDRRFAAITLLKPGGEKLWGSDQAPLVIAPILQTAAQSATKERKVQRVGPYRGMADHIRLDYVVPLTSIPGAAPLIVLHIDLTDWLFQTMQTWPVPSVSGETILIRVDGDQVLFLNELRHQKDTAASLRIPLATKNLLAAQVLRGDILQGSPVEGLDYRGVASMGVARSIKGTDWFLVAKVDRSELYNELAWDAAWVGFVGLLALLVSIAGFYLLRQRQQLLLAQALQQSQSERLNALSLLGAISDSSNDAIFAKDLEGRYILFNRAAGDFIGKPAGEVLGRDDRSLFPDEQAEMLMASGRRVIAENCALLQEEVLNTQQGERIFLATKGPLLDNDGKVIGIFGISHDITERKRAEAALRDSEVFKRAILDSIAAHIAVLDKQGVIIAVNQPWLCFAQDNGPNPGEPAKNCGIGVNYLEICAQSDGPYSEGALEARDGIQDVLAGRLPCYTIEYPCHSPTQQRWFNMTVTPLGSVGLGVVISHTNITERKLAELALLDSEQRFRLLFQQSPVPLAIVGQDGVMAAFNDRFVNTFGYALADVPTLAEWWPLAYPDPEYRRSVRDAWSAAVQGAVEQSIRIEPLEFRIACKDGKVCVVVTSGIIIGTDVLVTFFDITGRKAAEEALRARERYQRAVLDNFPFMVWLKDTDSRILAANKEFARIANVNDPVELIGKTDLDYWEVELAEQYRAQDRAVLESGEAITVEDEITESGRRFWIESYKSPVELDGQIIGTVGFARDITERKQAEAELQLWAQAFEQANFGLVIADARNNTFIAVNPAFARQRGYTQEELIGKPILMVYSADWVEEIKARVKDLKRNSHGVFETEHLCKDGRRFPVMMDITVIKSANGEPLTRVAYALDITERKAAEASLRESEKRFHDIVNASADWIWEVDAQVRYTYVSDSMRDLLGYSPEEILGKQPFDLMPPDEAKRVSAEFAAIAARREPFRDLDNINLHQDGSLRQVQTNGMPILDAEGKLLGYRGLDRDVTEMKQSEERLRISEERLQLALDATKDGLWDWDLRSGRAYLTTNYYEMTGYRPDEVTGDFEFFKRTVHPDDLPQVLETLEAHIEGKTPFCNYDYRLVTRSGEIRWMRGRGRVVERDAEGAPLRMIGTTSDICEHKTAEEALQRQAEELAQRNVELERFNRAMVGREMDMIALKKLVNSLSLQQGREPPYPLAFLNVPPAQPEEGELP